MNIALTIALLLIVAFFSYQLGRAKKEDDADLERQKILRQIKNHIHQLTWTDINGGY